MLNLLPYRRTLALLLALSCASLFAQTKELLPRVPAAMPEYTLGPGDEIAVHVVDMDEISDKPLRLDTGGFVDLPLVGRMQASGLTTEQFKTALAAKLTRYINQPQISVNLVENQNRTVSVIGSVNSPGVRSLQGPRHLIDVLSEAGGTKADAGPKIILTREARWGTIPLAGAHPDSTARYSTASLSLDGVLAGKDPAENILIEPGDVISIPRGEIVYVMGNVKRAGGFPLNSRENLSLLQAISLAEGMDKDASPGHARIIRPAPGNDGRPREIPVDISKIEAGKDSDVPLLANDILFIPNSALKSTSRRAAEAVLQVATGVLIYR